MKYIEFSMDDFRRNMKKNRKGSVILFFIIMAIGICVGWYFGLCYKQPVYTLDDTVVDYVNLDLVEKDEDYYYSAVCELQEKVQ